MNPKAGLWKLALTGVLIVLLVVAELAAIIWVAGELGWWTLAILISTTVLGVVLLQREWRKAWGALAETLKSGQLPGGRLADATLILLGGVLLVMPGLISDTIGLLLLLPFTRPFIRSAITWWASRKIGTTPTGAPGVVEGEVLPEEPHSDTLIPEIDPNTQTIRGEVLDEDPRSADRDRLGD